ncbi:MAG: phosphomannomutase/phosphoglucomutase [Desulfobacteraceae bacterium]|nr:phosphomannomutase/phosphoglucomutase [Desulfobacteraceae bacterium]
MNPNIFREYDIRGRIPDELDQEIVYRMGLSFGTYYHDRGAVKIGLGRDCRLSSVEFREALVKGLQESGIGVIDIGMVPTPLLYFSLFHLDLDGGIQLTASHNPPEYNGFKVCLGKTSIHGEEIQKIREIGESGKFYRGKGSVEEIDVIRSYLDYLQENLHQGSVPRKVVVDAGNGMGGMVAPEVYATMGVEVETLFCEPDGRFPNHHPDPTVPENLTDLISKVSELSADLGIAFDGDADRIGVVDSEGAIIWGDQLMIIFSRDLLERNPGAKIIGEVKCSQILFDDIRSHGGDPIMWKVGHSLIKSKLKEEGALLAGEMSGHLFFADRYFGYDDAIYAGARLLEILTKKEESIMDLLADLPRTVNTPEIRLDCPDEKKFHVVSSLVEDFKKEYEVIDVDGARVIFDGGWGLIRASNTQPVLVLRFEAQEETRLEEIRQIFMDKLNRIL